MKDYGKILESFYFEIFTLSGQPLGAASFGRFFARTNSRPGGFGMFQFTDVEYMPHYDGVAENHTWKCYIKNFQVGKYLDIIWESSDVWIASMNNTKFRPFFLTAEPLVNGVRKWRISTGSGHVLTRVSDSYIKANKADRSFRWTMRPRILHLDYHLNSIKYEDRTPENINSSPIDVITNGTVQTGPGITVDREQGVTFSKENSFEYGFTETLAVGATVKSSVKVPGGLAETSAELRVDASLSATQSNRVTTTIEYSFKDTINVPENTDAKIMGWVDWEENGEFKFDAYFHIRGTAAKADGDSEADPLDAEQVKLILIEKGFDGTFEDSSSPATVTAKVSGVMTGSFGITSHLTVTT